MGSPVISGEALRGLLVREIEIVYAPESIEQLIRYLGLLERWNHRINLTASIEWQDLKPLFAEAIWAAGFYQEPNRRHLDLGSGGGFPALPLKILRPQMQLEMVESRLKRSVFLETVVRELGLEQAKVHNLRVEEFLSGDGIGVYDCISWKGLKLGEDILTLLLSHTDHRSQFWAFHGERAPFESMVEIEKQLSLVRRERFPLKDSWYLSIYKRA